MKKKASADWRGLDNAAKIFPCSSDKRDTKVFRFVCELFEDVDASVLQRALDITILDFPMYLATLKRGVFWFYLEKSDIAAVVVPESQLPCYARYDHNVQQLLFEISYHRKRINLEIYHALTDGTGALSFFQTLVCHYIAIAQNIDFKSAGFVISDASSSQKLDDSFNKYYSGKPQAALPSALKAFRIRGQKTPENRLKIIGGEMETKKILALARQYDVSITIYLAALLMQSIHSTMRVSDLKKPVVASIPVNLRKVFPSQSTSNFFSVINVACDFRKSPSIGDIIEAINGQLKEGLEKGNLELRLNKLMALEKNLLISAVPLFIKNPVMHYFYHRTDKYCTVTLSNLGRIDLPPAFAPFARVFEVFVSTDKLQLCTCSYGERFCATFSSAFINTDVQMEFFRALAEQGVDVEISAN